MTQLLYGDRIGKTTILQVGCNAVIFDDARERVLLTQRADNGKWCLPGGRMETGESASEAGVREAWEETSLEVEAFVR
ncbi:MAG: NUDIX domain-containing protein [Chloroflexi bacterium]|nr:NUDIX domain-containing protein [Chloroflexota bacterium]